MNEPARPPSTALRVLFALEGLAWLALVALDLFSIPAQMEVARRVPLAGMPIWIALTALLCASVVVSSLLGVRAGRGAVSRHVAGPLGTLVLVFGVGFRAVLWFGVMAWLTTMTGLQSV